MRVVNSIFVALIGLPLAGCLGSSPSESEITTAISEGYPSCAYIAVENVKKVNGTKISDLLYEIEVSYSLKILPMPENVQTIEDGMKEEKKFGELGKELQEKVGFINKHAYDMSDMTQPEKQKFFELYKQQFGEEYNAPEINKKLSAHQEYFSQKHDFVTDAAQRFAKTCPGRWDSVGNNFLSNFRRTIESTPNDFLTQGVKSDIQETIRMRKTDNGWMLLKG